MTIEPSNQDLGDTPDSVREYIDGLESRITELEREISELLTLSAMDDLKESLAKRDLEQQIKAIDELKGNCNIYMASPTDKMIARECVTVEEFDAYHWSLKNQLRNSAKGDSNGN